MNIFYLTVVLNSALVSAATTYRPVRKTEPSSLSKSVAMVHDLAANLSFVIGIGFVLLSVYKYVEYRQNPLANPLGRAVSLLFTGLALVGMYYIPMPVMSA